MERSDREILRELAKQYRDVADRPVQAERRRLWSDHFSLKPVRPPVMVSIGMWNKWCMDYFGDATLTCRAPALREQERAFRMHLFQQDIGDDTVLEPWVTVHADCGEGWDGLWGLRARFIEPETKEGAWQFDPALRDLADADRLQVPHHAVNEAVTQARRRVIEDAIGDILPVIVNRGPRALGFSADLVTLLCKLRGLEQVMMDMYEHPEWLHRVMAFMRDGILTNHGEAEAAGDFSLACGINQAMPYCDSLEWPKPDPTTRLRNQLWGFCAAQEMTLVSPAMHDEFILQYQLPIMKHFGLVHYGCCEDLTRKIDMLRQIPNLRSIAVTPVADVAACAEQIKADYAFSWRPNPTDMVCAGFNPALVRRIIADGLAATRGCRVHIHLKDIETVGGDVTRLRRWTELVKGELDRAGY